jgi:acetyl esterase/lipase
MLLNPMLDDRNDSFSSHQMAHVDQWDRHANEAGWALLLGERRGGLDVSHYSAPGRATDLSGLPPAFLDVGSVETLRDETVAFANGIWQAGGAAELHVWPGGFHGYEFVAPHSRLAQVTWDTRSRWLRRMVAE